MLRIIGTFIKLAVLSVLILALGNWIQLDGKTISDQIKTHIAHAEQSDVVDQLKGWAQGIVRDVREGSKKRAIAPISRSASSDTEHESISPSERQKLRNLIRELNGTSQGR